LEQVVLAGPGPDHLSDGPARVAVVSTAQALAVEGDDFAIGSLGDAMTPVSETLGEAIMVEQCEDTPDSIML